MSLLLTPGDTKLPPLTNATRAAAAAHVERHATSPADRDDLLAVLGLGGRIRPQVTTLACGHPSTEGARDPSYRGVQCRACGVQRHAR